MLLRTLRHVLALLVLLAVPSAQAEEVPPQARAAWQAMVQVPTVSASFTQTRSSALLSRPLVSTGTLQFARPDKLAWQVLTPGRSTLVMQGSRVGMVWPDLGVREEIDLAGNPEIAGVVQAMMVWLSGDLDAVLRDYSIQWHPGPPARAHLLPRSEAIRSMLARIELELQGDPPWVGLVTLHEPDGDRVEIRLSDVKQGQLLPPETFVLPDGVR